MAKKADSFVEVDISQFVTSIVIVFSTLIFSTSMFFSAREIGNGLRESGTGTKTSVATDNTDTIDKAVIEGQAGSTTIDDDPYLGDKSKAKVAIVEFTDFECPFCQRHHLQTYPSLIREYVNSGKVIYVQRDLPLSFHDPVATNQAIAAECIDKQLGREKYFEFGDLVFTNTSTNGAGVGGRDVLAEYASNVGADVTKFLSCYDNKETADEVAKDLSDATAAGVNGTPGFIIGVLDGDNVDGVIVSGAQPLTTFQQVIDEQLDRV